MSDQREITIKRNWERLGIGGAFTDLRTPGGGIDRPAHPRRG